MKKLISTLALIYLTTGMLFAQNTFSVSPGTRLVASGGVQVVLGQGTLTNNGTISGTSSGGTWIFKGPIILNGTGVTTVSNLVIDHSYGITQLNSMISVMNTATLAAGNLQTNDNLNIRTDLNSSANLVVIAVPTGTIQGLIVKATITVGSCSSFTSTLSVNISGPPITFQWQSSPDSTNWANVSNANSSNYLATVNGTVFYRCLIGATSGNYNDTANAIKLMLDIPSAVISGVASVLVGNTATLTAATTGGTWSSSDAGVLTVNASTGLITGISSGTATITYNVTNGVACSGSGTKRITVGDGIKPIVTITDPAAVCSPGTIDLTAAAVTAGSDAGLTYTYFTDAAGTNTLNSPQAVTTSGTYYIKGTNNTNVSFNLVPVVVTINPLPSGNITAAQGTILCGTGASLILTGAGGNTYAWTRNGVAITGVTGSQLTLTTPGVYTNRMTSAAGCQAAAGNSITVTFIQNPKAAFSFDSYCINRPVTFSNSSAVTGSGTVSYQWSDNGGNSSTATAPVFTYNQTQTYNMKLKVTPLACPAIADSVVLPIAIEVPAAAIRMKPPTNALINEPIDLPARSFGKAYLWTPSTGLSNPNAAIPNATLTADQEYRITITAPSGCLTVDSLLVRIYDNRIYVANVFTPNGDGINDKLLVNLAGIRQLRYFRVFNRYAKMVFETKDATIGWDGRYNNEMQPMDTYVWAAEVVDKFGNITTQRGSVTLLR